MGIYGKSKVQNFVLLIEMVQRFRTFRFVVVISPHQNEKLIQFITSIFDSVLPGLLSSVGMKIDNVIDCWRAQYQSWTFRILLLLDFNVR